ncbi:hypothetical protein [Candidatus Ferrigenium straubiae]|jgi:hypothetical protein|uniref:hypothetical protein n=1 Tax=Candidatus Ferrigenium straubiae TaxID=2919506 RepID=UPI003F4AE387
MNRNMTATETRDAGKRCGGSICWSSEWSFVEDTDATSQKVVRPLINKQLPAEKHSNANTGSQAFFASCLDGSTVQNRRNVPVLSARR